MKEDHPCYEVMRERDQVVADLLRAEELLKTLLEVCNQNTMMGQLGFRGIAYQITTYLKSLEGAK